MKSTRINFKRITALFLMALVLLSSVSLQNAYAQDVCVPVDMNIEAELIDFTITNSVTVTGRQGEMSLSISPIVVSNNSDDQYIKISNVKYQSTLPGLSLVPNTSDFTVLGDSYSIVLNGYHDFANGDLVEDKPIMINGGSQTFNFSGHIGLNCSPYANVECGNFIVTIKKTSEPEYNGIPLSQLANISWSTGSDASIAAVLEAAYSGVIDPETYCGWKVGDERRIRLNDFYVVYNPAQNTYNSTCKIASTEVLLTLYNHGGETLSDGRECQYVVGFRDLLANDKWYMGSKTSGFRIGDAENDYSQSFVDKDCNAIYNALPDGTKQLFKEWDVYVAGPAIITALSPDGSNWITECSTIQCLKRYMALPAVNNIFSMEKQASWAMNRNPEDEYVTTQYEYYKTEQNLVKHLIGRSNNSNYWTRTPNSAYKSDDCFTAYAVTVSGNLSYYANIKESKAFAPVGCI